MFLVPSSQPEIVRFKQDQPGSRGSLIESINCDKGTRLNALRDDILNLEILLCKNPLDYVPEIPGLGDASIQSRGDGVDQGIIKPGQGNFAQSMDQTAASELQTAVP